MTRLALLLTLLAAPALAQVRVSHPAPPPRSQPAIVRVALQTSAGPIVIALDMKHAPLTAGNFLKYVDSHHFDGTTFYRAARTKGAPKSGFVQGGIDHDIRLSFPPVAHEPTSKTGLHHLDGTISMARTEPGTAMGDFFITVGPAASMDARKGAKPTRDDDGLGYAAFGRVVSGMATVKRILALPTARGGSGSMVGQMIDKPVRIISARRVG